MALLGYRVEAGKRRADTVRRPVSFGDQGVEVVTYEVDAVHDELAILVEIEAGRGGTGNLCHPFSELAQQAAGGRAIRSIMQPPIRHRLA